MALYAYRVIDVCASKQRWGGIVSATSLANLAWIIESEVDPGSVEIKRLGPNDLHMCFTIGFQPDDEMDGGGYIEFDECSLAEDTYNIEDVFITEKGWRRDWIPEGTSY